MVDLYFNVLYRSDVLENSWSTMSSDLLYPISISQGLQNYNPSMPFVANSGELVFYLDNLSTDFKWSISGGTYSDGGYGSRLAFLMSNSSDVIVTSDVLDTDISICLMHGRVESWQPLPGLFEERTVEGVIKDGMYRLSKFSADGFGVELEGNAGDLMLQAVSSLPYSGYGFNISTDTSTIPVAWNDVNNGKTKLITAAGKIALSDFGHLFMEHNQSFTQRVFHEFTYLTRDEWIDRGVTIATFDNQWLDLDYTGNNGELQYYPIYVTYKPSKFADTNVIVFEYLQFPTIKPGATWSSFAEYRDPDNEASLVGVTDTDIITPVSGTDYVVTGVASSDLEITLTNLGTAGKYEITNNGSVNASFTKLQIRGKPVLQYNNVTISNEAGSNTYENSLNVTLPYVQDDDYAHQVLEFLSAAHTTSSPPYLVRSVTFNASQDTDWFDVAKNARIGNIVRIIEDVNGIDDDYRIIGWNWLINYYNDIQVTFNLYPNTMMANHMTDSDGSYMTDSDGKRFSFWR